MRCAQPRRCLRSNQLARRLRKSRRESQPTHRPPSLSSSPQPFSFPSQFFLHPNRSKPQPSSPHLRAAGQPKHAAPIPRTKSFFLTSRSRSYLQFWESSTDGDEFGDSSSTLAIVLRSNSSHTRVTTRESKQSTRKIPKEPTTQCLGLDPNLLSDFHPDLLDDTLGDLEMRSRNLGEGVSAADKERALQLREVMFAWITGVQVAARVQEIFAQPDRSGLSEVQFESIHKMAEERLHRLAWCIAIEATEEERRWMGPDPKTSPKAGEVVRWALLEGGSTIPEQAVRLSFLSEATPWLDSPVASSTVPPPPRPTTEPPPSS